jgi:hypothetical protein
MPLCYAEQNQIACGQELRAMQHRKTACTLESAQNTSEEKFKVMGKTTCSIFLNARKEMNRNTDNAKYPFMMLLTAHLGPKYRSRHSHQATG